MYVMVHGKIVCMVKWHTVDICGKILFDQHILFDLCATVSLDGNGGR